MQGMTVHELLMNQKRYQNEFVNKNLNYTLNVQNQGL